MFPIDWNILHKFQVPLEFIRNYINVNLKKTALKITYKDGDIYIKKTF